MTTNLSLSQAIILNTLTDNHGKVVSHRALARKVWRKKPPATWLTALSLHMRQLRRNVPSLRHQIVNVHGRGYMLGCTMVY